MKVTGIVRRVDGLGRIVLPIELRRTLAIDIKDPLEMFVDGESLILRKYEPACIFCGSSDHVKRFATRKICKECIDKLKND